MATACVGRAVAQARCADPSDHVAEAAGAGGLVVMVVARPVDRAMGLAGESEAEAAQAAAA